jgi:predicted nucleic acid-binding protein
MRICIDSNQFIFGIGGTDPASETIMSLLPVLEVVIPRLIIKEVSRNLTEAQTKALFALLNKTPQVKIVDEPVSFELVQKYINLGLPEKADAFIGAFVEWQGAKYLISDNRHFLSDLSGATFEVLSPEEFLYRHYHTKL